MNYGLRHAPELQTLEMHWLLQRPQLRGSLTRSTQVEPHFVLSAGHVTGAAGSTTTGAGAFAELIHGLGEPPADAVMPGLMVACAAVDALQGQAAAAARSAPAASRQLASCV